MDIGPDAIFEISVNVWRTMFEAELTRREVESVAFGEGALSSSVSISGAWNGTVLLTCDGDTARKLAAKMFELPLDTVSDEEVRDALGEVANMCGGNVKGLAPSPSKLSLPIVVPAIDARGADPACRVLHRVGFDYDGAPIALTVFSSESGASP